MTHQLSAMLVGVLCVLAGCSSSHDRDERSFAARSGALPDAARLNGEAGAGGSESIQPQQPQATAGAPSSTPPEPFDDPNQPPIDPISIDHTGADNPAQLPAGEVKRLMAGGPLGTLRWLYPYDGTVFPRDMLSPSFMWEGDPATQAVYFRIKSRKFEYKTVITPMVASGGVSGIVNTPIQPQLRVPQDIWDKASATTQGKGDPFTIELSTLVGGVVAGPVVSQFIIAPGAIKGSIYYTTYSSSLPGAPVGWGSLVRIPARGQAEVVVRGDSGNSCTGCHAVSANGARLILQTMNPSAPTAAAPDFAAAYSYTLNPASGATGKTALNRYAAFAALYPDGSKYLTGSLVPDPSRGGFGAGPLGTSYGNIALLDKSVPVDATLYDSDTAQIVPDTGIPSGALMPMFSPDGKHLTFNDFAIDRAHGLAVMDYDTTVHKASNYKLLMQEDPASVAAAPVGMVGTRPGWPAFLPDNNAVVFVRTDSQDFTGGAQGVGAATLADFTPDRQSTNPNVPKLYDSDLYIADVATGSVTMLARAMGFNTPADAAAGKTYMPFGANDLHHNYNTTVSPVAAGGYFWVFFDSVRNYGNLGIEHSLWATAVELRPDGSYTTDPSQPAFYLEGQQFGTNNHRAFAARDLCKQTGPCTTGIDCCSGFCSETCGPPPPPDQCSKTDEACTASSDCCDSANACVNGFCAIIDLL